MLPLRGSITFPMFFPVHVEDKAQHGGWILLSREEHDLVAGELCRNSI